MIRPGEFPALTVAASHLLRANFLEKDGVRPESFDRHLAALEPQNFALVLKRTPDGPVPVGAAQVAIQERRPPDSVQDIDAVFGARIPQVCAATIMPSGRTMPDLRRHFYDVAGIEAIAVWPEYRRSRTAPYALLMYAQIVRYLVARGNISLMTAILDMRPGEVFSQLQTILRTPFNLYGKPIRPRVYWTEGWWVHLNNQEVPLDQRGQPAVPVPNYSAPAYIEIQPWLERLRLGDAKDRLTYDRVMGEGLLKYAAFDPSFERSESLSAG